MQLGLWLLPVLWESLACTLVLELVFAVLVRMKGRKNYILLVLVNILTNPVVVLLYYITRCCTRIPIIPVLLLLEVSAVVVEGTYYKKYGEGIRNPMLFSIGANLFSYWVGELLQACKII